MIRLECEPERRAVMGRGIRSRSDQSKFPRGPRCPSTKCQIEKRWRHER